MERQLQKPYLTNFKCKHGDDNNKKKKQNMRN